MAAGLPAVPAGLPAVPAGLPAGWPAGWPALPNKPLVGHWLRFRYPSARGVGRKHGFYDDFPIRRKVRATESRVSLHADIQCLEVRTHWLPFYHIRHGKARIRRGYFMAVRFVNDDGLMLWTNFSRDDYAWLLPSEDSD